MKKLILILFLGFSFVANAQIHYSSSSQTIEWIRTKNLGNIPVTKKYTNTNGNKSSECLIRGIKIDCKLVSKCQNNDCDELEKYLKENNVGTIPKKSQNSKTTNQTNKSNYYIAAYTDKKEICVGEQIYVEYIFYIKKTELARDWFNRPAVPEIGKAKTNFNGFWVKEETTKNNWIEEVEYVKIPIFNGTLTAQKSGKLTINSSLEFIYKGREKREINSKSITINVKELSNQPIGFNGAVGNMNINSEINKDTINANETITYKLTITGTGNIELIKPLDLEFPEDFEVYDPKISQQLTANGRQRSWKTFEYLLIPRYKGEYTIASTQFIVYNNKTKKYETKKSSQHVLTVKASKDGIDESPDPQIVQTRQKDINYIATDTNLRAIGKNVITKNLFYILFFLPIALIILLKIYDRKIGKTNKNSTSWKKRKANKIALKRLKNAQKCINNNDFDRFFEEIEKSLWGYFADKFKVKPADLSKETVSDYFNSSEINKKIEEGFITLLNECEFARYAPENNKNAQMDTLLKKAKRIIIKVETVLK